MPGSNLIVPEDIRADLVRAQTENLSSIRPPRVKMMPAAACLFEFEDTQDTPRTFEGVILNQHPRHVLWPLPYGTEPANDDEKGPGCVSPDGRFGVPRPGFVHAHLGGEAARGDERPECATCPYNEWNSKGLIGQTGKGKACTNQKAVFILLSNRELPVELTLPPTSLRVMDQYLLNLANRHVPVQTVVTKFSQEKISRGSISWGQLVLEEGEQLAQEVFETVLVKRSNYMEMITPRDPLSEDLNYESVVESDEDDGEDAPF